MTEEQITGKKIFAGEKKASMKRREDHHDYQQRRMYMVTMEVEGRRPLFGRVVGNPFATDGSGEVPRMELSELGRAVQSEWLGIHGYYPQIEVMAVQMMPDHMHGILFVKDRLPVHLGQVIAGFKTGCRRLQRALEQQAMIVAAQPQPTEKANPLAGKTGAAGGPGPLAGNAGAGPISQQAKVPPSQAPAYRPLFAPGYNDLILRTYDELPRWQNYLRDNPRRLLMRRARPEWLRPFFHLEIGSHQYSGIGNQALLKAPWRMAVRASRRLTPQELETTERSYLDAARRGAVLVSPAISPGEKRIMRAAFDAGLPTIVVLKNGFTPMSKPHGEQFYACSAGRLLLLSPWAHHNEKTPLTVEECRQMNHMAMEISR